eukprot:681958-Amphidinium_carterae.1
MYPIKSGPNASCGFLVYPIPSCIECRARGRTVGGHNLAMLLLQCTQHDAAWGDDDEWNSISGTVLQFLRDQGEHQSRTAQEMKHDSALDNNLIQTRSTRLTSPKG